MPDTPKPPRQPATPPPPPATPGSVRPVKRAAPPKPRSAEPLPVGKLASTPAPPSPARGLAPRSLDIGTSGGSSAFRPRRRGTPVGVWIGVAAGVIAVGALVVVLLTRDKDPKKVARKNDDATAESAADQKPTGETAKTAGNAAEKEKAPPEKAQPGDAKKTDPKKTIDGKPPADKPKPRAADPPRPAVVPTPPADAVPVSQQFRGIEEVPTGEVAAGLANVIGDSLALLEKDKFDEFFNKHVDPRDRGAPPSAVPGRSRIQSPYDVLLQGSERTATIFSALAVRLAQADEQYGIKPHLFEEGKIAVFDLGPQTRPTFVEREGKWYLSRGVATSMKRRFRELTKQEEIVYLLEVTSGMPAAAPAESVREGSELALLEQLTQAGAFTAVTTGAAGELPRSAVMFTEKYNGGDDGLKLLGELNQYSPVMVLVVDALNDKKATEDLGYMEFDDLTRVEYVRFVNVRTENTVTIHFYKMEKLKTLILDGGRTTRDADVREHLAKAAELRHLAIKGEQISDSTFEELGGFPALQWIDIESTGSTITDQGVAAFRARRPTVWVDY